MLTTQRIQQHFFRRAVLSSYRGRCCMSGLSESRLLIASPIVSWSKDKESRLNPSNGLCLSALHDRAFDKGLLSLIDDWRIVLSDTLRERDGPVVKATFLPIDGLPIKCPKSSGRIRRFCCAIARKFSWAPAPFRRRSWVALVYLSVLPRRLKLQGVWPTATRRIGIARGNFGFRVAGFKAWDLKLLPHMGR